MLIADDYLIECCINIGTNSLQYALDYYIAYVSLSLLMCTSHNNTNLKLSTEFINVLSLYVCVCMSMYMPTSIFVPFDNLK